MPLTPQQAIDAVAAMTSEQVDRELAIRLGWKSPVHCETKAPLSYASLIGEAGRKAMWLSPEGFWDRPPSYCSNISAAMALTEGPWWNPYWAISPPYMWGADTQAKAFVFDGVSGDEFIAVPTTAEAVARAALVGALTKETGDGEAKG